MKKAQEIKKDVREKYTEIAQQTTQENAQSCCGVGGCSTVDHEIFAEDYSKLEGYNSDADLGLGCGLPTEFAQIKKGDTVLDLGSGAGNDCFVARAITGADGKVMGVDMTDEMINQARKNAQKLKYNNVEFRKGDIEELPVEDDSVDVVISNCVLNLVPDKQKAFNQMYRVIKPEGHFSVSDVVLKGELPDAIKNDAEMYAGCVAGAIDISDYVGGIKKAGFENVKVQKEKEVFLPDEILTNYLSKQGIEEFRSSEVGVYSITVYGQKPKCGPDCCC